MLSEPELRRCFGETLAGVKKRWGTKILILTFQFCPHLLVFSCSLKTALNRSGEIALPVKCLPDKHEDLKFNPLNTCGKDMLAHTSNAGEMIDGQIPGGLLAS